MARYIDADALRTALELERIGTDFFSRYGLNRAIWHIKHTPTADVVEVKHGRWEEERWCDNYQHICSLCHSTVRVHPKSVAYRYCPYCGAKMDEKEGTGCRENVDLL